METPHSKPDAKAGAKPGDKAGAKGGDKGRPQAQPAGAAPGATAAKPRFFSLIPNDLAFDYLRWRWWALGASWTIIGAGIVLLLIKGLHYGIDFTGGTLIQVQVSEAADIGAMRDLLAKADVGAFALQSLGDAQHQEFLITLGLSNTAKPGQAESVSQRVEKLLKQRFTTLNVRRVESVGPKVGEELKLIALESVLFALGAILLYIWVRFQWRYSIGAIVATVHDVLIVMTALVLTQREMSLTVLAAVLTIAGYSVNDTVVVFDRIRENTRRFAKKDMAAVMNESINQTLSRTLLTSTMTLIVVVVMFFFGGEIINDFAFCMLVGVIIGTYSSIFSASPVVYMLYRWFPPKLK